MFSTENIFAIIVPQLFLITLVIALAQICKGCFLKKSKVCILGIWDLSVVLPLGEYGNTVVA